MIHATVDAIHFIRGLRTCRTDYATEYYTENWFQIGLKNTGPAMSVLPEVRLLPPGHCPNSLAIILQGDVQQKMRA